ncbi:MAG: hypothetical protein ACKV2T_04210 [Kofleriaceae bacterium]
MSKSLLRSVLLVGALASAATADEKKDPPPVDAPPSCIDPVGKDGLSTALAKGPRVVGTYKLVAGKKLTIPGLRLLATARFVPDRVGATTGEWLPGLGAVLLPDVDRDGESYRNSVDQHGYDPLRIGTYRISVKSVSTTKAGTIVETLVEDLACMEDYVHAPLAPNESKTLWISTEATRNYGFSTGHWYDQVPRFYIAVSSGLAPDVQQEKGTKSPHGWISAQAWDSNGGHPSWDDRYLDKLRAGDVLKTAGYTVEVLKVVLGPDTTVVDGRVHTKGRDPVISALVKVTRRAKPLEGVHRLP